MPRLPELVTLPAASMIEAAELRTALGISRAVLHLWRKRHAFPASHRSGVRQLTCAAAVETWLLARGVAVARVAPPPPPPVAPPFVPMPPGYQPHEAVL